MNEYYVIKIGELYFKGYTDDGGVMVAWNVFDAEVYTDTRFGLKEEAAGMHGKVVKLSIREEEID